MKRTLKYFLRREAYNRTKQAFRELETANKSEPGTQADERKPQVSVETRVSGTGKGGVNADTDLERALQRMDDYDFEHFVADLWERMGWKTEVSTQSADRGIDVVATRRSPYEEKALIQAKRYGPNTTVGSPAIQQYASLKHQRHGVDKVLVVTTSGFSGQAAELAHQLNVKLIDGESLVSLVEDLDAMDLVEQYVPAIREPEPEREAGPSTAESTVDTSRGVATESQPADPVQVDATVSEARSTEEETEGPLAKRLPDERWKWVAGATGAWVLGVALAGTDLGVIVLLAWIGLPYAVLKDGTWTRWRRWYAVVAVVPGVGPFVGAWYLLMRWRAVGFESAEDETESSEGAEDRRQYESTSENRASDYSYDHYTEAVEDVKQLKREKRHEEAESLLWWCIESAEREAAEQSYDAVPPWYYKHLAIVYRKDGRYAEEVAVLERYIETGGQKDELLDRIETVRELAS